MTLEQQLNHIVNLTEEMRRKQKKAKLEPSSINMQAASKAERELDVAIAQYRMSPVVTLTKKKPRRPGGHNWNYLAR